MTSTNSLNNNRFIPVMKNVFKRNLILFLILPVFSLVFSVFISQGVTDGYQEIIQQAAEEFTLQITDSILLGTGMFLYGAGTVLMLIFAVTLFREIYTKRSSTFYFSVPVKRGAYFNANMIFGITSLLLSYIILVCIPIAIVKGNAAYQAGFYVFDIPVFLNNITITALCVAVAYAAFLLCAVLAGRTWQYLVLCYLIVQVGNMLTNFRGYINTIWGFHIESSLSWIASPSAIYTDIFGELVGNPLKYFIALAVQFAVLYAVGYLVFKKRKAEVAEVSLTGKIVPAVLITLSLFAASFGFLSLEISSSVIRLCVAVAVTLLETVILSAIFYRKALTKSTLKCFIVTVAVTVVTFAAVEFVPNISFKNYVPEASEVESVTLEENVDFGNEGALPSKLFAVLFEFLPEETLYAEQIGEPYTFTSDDAKEKIEAFHKKMVAQSTIDNAYSEDYYYHGYYSVKLVYHLKDGKTVTRSYCVGTMDVYKEYIALMKTEEAIRQTVTDFFKDKEIMYIGVDEYATDEEIDDDNYDWELYPYVRPTVYASLDEYDTLLDMIVKDRLNEPESVFADLGLSSAFDVFDYNDYYRDEGFWNIGFDEEEDEEDFVDYMDYRDISIRVNVLKADATDAQKELLKNMTAEEMAEYEEKIFNGFYDNYPFDAIYIHLNRNTDTNTVEYLKSLGLIQ